MDTPLRHWWKPLAGFWGVAIVGVGINIVSSWLTSPSLPIKHTPLGWLLDHLMITLPIAIISLPDTFILEGTTEVRGSFFEEKKKKRSLDQVANKKQQLGERSHGCIHSIMGALESTSQGITPSYSWTSEKNVGSFCVGHFSGSAVLQRVAESVSLHGINPAKMTSIERRFARFIANDRVVVSKIWDLFLSEVLPFGNGKPPRFVLDCTPFRSDATIVYLGLLVHSRVLPVAWAVMPATEKGERGVTPPTSRQSLYVASYLDTA